VTSALFSGWLLVVAQCDAWVARSLFPLALVILISGLDDLALDCVCLWAWLMAPLTEPCATEPRPTEPDRSSASREGACPPRKAHRHLRPAVARTRRHRRHGGAQCLRHQLLQLSFLHWRLPERRPTLDAIRELESRFPHVHLAVCPHNGPTSKADCLNWIYQRMLLFEEHHEYRFDIVITHDAEDLIHPEAFSHINAYADEFDMVQIPVLPLPTPLRDLVHGIYCDEFAEWQIKDMPRASS
jgi:adsorption protein B